MRFQSSGTVAERPDKRPGIPGTQPAASPNGAKRAVGVPQRSPSEMNFKSHIPFLTVPLALVLLSILLVDAVCGNFDSSKDIPRYAIWSLWGGYFLVSGLIRWNKPYVMTDDKGLTVYGRLFSNHPTKEIPWGLIQGHTGRSFWDIRLKMADGGTIKIPINGMSGKAVAELLTLIDKRESGMRTMRSPNHHSPSAPVVGEP